MTKTRQDKTAQDKARQGMTTDDRSQQEEGKTIQDKNKARQNPTTKRWQDIPRDGKTIQEQDQIRRDRSSLHYDRQDKV